MFAQGIYFIFTDNLERDKLFWSWEKNLCISLRLYGNFIAYLLPYLDLFSVGRGSYIHLLAVEKDRKKEEKQTNSYILHQALYLKYPNSFLE